MKTLSPRFTMNADQNGNHIFQLNRREQTPNGDIAVYDRFVGATGSYFGMEVFKVKIVKAGIHHLKDKTGKITELVIDTDYESYPGGASFGKHAFFCVNEAQVEKAIAKLRGSAILGEPEIETEVVEFTPLAPGEKPAKAVKPRSSSRPANPYKLPEGEFSVKDIMVHNGLDTANMSAYQGVANWVRDESSRPDGAVIKTEARKVVEGPGKKTNFFKAREVKPEIVPVPEIKVDAEPVAS